MTLERGTLLHQRYRIVEILGQGGMASVYRAVDENLGVNVAVKDNLYTSEEYARQFRLEAVILASLRHPNLPRVSDHFSVGEEAQYLVMDFIEGEDLRQRMERLGTISENDAVMIGAAICDALTYLHTRSPSILHRDIKPGNVKITPEGSIFLVDFGLVKLVHGTQTTTTGARAMTPGYSPPEQYGTARTDPRTDIYSLGATLYAALTGFVPEDGLARVMDNARLTALRKRNPKVKRRLAEAIEKAMAVDPGDRFDTAEQFKKALLGALPRSLRLAGNYTVTPPPGVLHISVPTRTSKTGEAQGQRERALQDQASSRKRITLMPQKRSGLSPGWLLMLIVLFVGSFGIMVVLPGDQVQNLFTHLPVLITRYASSWMSATNTVETEVPLATATIPPTLRPTVLSTEINSQAGLPTASVPFPPTPLGSPSTQLAYASNRSGTAQIYLSDLIGESVVPITNLRDGACQPSWAPDGLRLVFVSPCRLSQFGAPQDISDEPPKDTALFLVDVDGSNLITLPTVPGGDSDPAWSPDGQRIAFTSLRDGRPLLYVLNLKDKSVLRLIEPTADFEAARQPSWSPLGTQIAFTMRRGDSYQIWGVSDKGQGMQQISRSGQVYWDYSPYWSSDGKTIFFTQQASQGPALPWIMSIAYEKRGTGESQRLDLGPLPVGHLRLSPDLPWFLFEGRDLKDNQDIFYASLVGGPRTRITTDPATDFDPVWRPAPKP